MSDETGGVGSGHPEAGWYVDALGVYRWWDGAAWTVHTLPAVPDTPAAAPVGETLGQTPTAAEAAPSSAEAPATPGDGPEQPVVEPPVVEPPDVPAQPVVETLDDGAPNREPATHAAPSAAASVVAAVDAVAASETPVPPPAPPAPPPSPWAGRGRLIAGAVGVLAVIAVIVLVVVLHGGGDSSTPLAQDPTSDSPTTGASPSDASTDASTDPSSDPSGDPSSDPSDPASDGPTTASPEQQPIIIAQELLTKTFAHDCTFLADTTAAFRTSHGFTLAKCTGDPDFFGSVDQTGCLVATSHQNVHGALATVRYATSGATGCAGHGMIGLIQKRSTWLVFTIKRAT